METRRADFAGSWYPGTDSECRRAIGQFNEISQPCPEEGHAVIGGIVPHAGWVFSGSIACNVIRCLAEHTDPDACVIFGRHLHPGGQNYIMREGFWNTPLGDLEIDKEMASSLIDSFPFTVETARDYDQDNTIELQLPFIKYFFPETKIIPMGVPPRESTLEIAEKTAQIAQALGRKTVFLGSTDLTHYGYNYGYTPHGVGEKAVNWVKENNDKRVVDLMLTLDSEAVIKEALENQNACCSGAAAAAIRASRAWGATKAKKIIYSTSYDVRPDDSFVGYVGVIFQT
jgi:AmmeMemoRadiSam system protein B